MGGLNKGGRPKKLIEEKRIFKEIKVRYNQKEYLQLLEVSSKFDLKMTPYIRRKSLEEGDLKGKFVRKDFKDLVVSLNKVGSNLNQMMRAVNQQGVRFKDENSKEIFEELLKVFVEIKSSI
jgi:hypothetical protein